MNHQLFACGVRCGLVLAGGEGQRLRPFIYQLRGDSLPKQYINFIGTRSMLEHTFHRAEKLIAPERIFTVINEQHLCYPAVRRQLSNRARSTVISQPENRDTGPGILLPFMHLSKRYRNSTVAIFPSDHFIFEEDRFMAHVDLAFQMVEQNPSLLVLLGIEPNEAEPEYGYILPEGKWGNRHGDIRRVRRFVEKPRPDAVLELIRQGGLWNTMVMVSKSQTLLGLVRAIEPELYRDFEAVRKVIGKRNESFRVKEIYRQMGSFNFSKGILERLPAERPSCLSVLSVRGVSWSDWGLPQCIGAALKKLGYFSRLQCPEGISQTKIINALGRVFIGRHQVVTNLQSPSSS